MPGITAQKWWSKLAEENQAAIARAGYSQFSSEEKQAMLAKAKELGLVVEDEEDAIFYFYVFKSIEDNLPYPTTGTLHSEILYEANPNPFQSLDPGLLTNSPPPQNLKKIFDITTHSFTSVLVWEGGLVKATIHLKEFEVKYDDFGLMALYPLLNVLTLGTPYVLKKTYNALRNLYHGEKVARSVWRLAGIGAGAYVGLFVVGLIASSAFPVVGNLVYLLVMASATAGCLFAKYSAKMMSALAVKLGVYGTEEIINPSNPDKYRMQPTNRWLDLNLSRKVYRQNMNIKRPLNILKQLKQYKSKKCDGP